MPTRAQVTTIDPSKLSAWATELDTACTSLDGHLGTMLHQFNDASWSGVAKNAAATTVEQQNTEGRKMSQEVRELATALRAGDTRLTGEKNNLLTKVSDAEHDAESPIPLVVGDNWTIGINIIPTEYSDEQLQKMSERITHHQGLINQAYNAFVNAVTEVAASITTNSVEIRTRGDQVGDGVIVNGPIEADSGRLGSEDGKTVKDAINPDGTVNTEMMDQVAGNLPPTILTDDQLEALASGREIDTLPASVQEYYREFYQSAGKDGLLAFNDHLKGQEAAGNTVAAGQRDALANGLLVTSNEKVGTGRNPDGTLQSPGSYKELPQDVQELISTRVAGPDSNATEYPTQSVEGVDKAKNRFLDESGQFADLLSQSNPGYEGGVELSRELTRQSAALGTGFGDSEYSGLPGSPTSKLSDLEPTMRDYLEVSGRNHEATTQLLTGETEPGSVPLEEGYNPNKVFQPLLQYDWTDSDGQKAPELFGWIGEEAIPTPASGDNPGVTLEQSQQAGKAASGLASILTDGGKDGNMGPFESLMDSPYHDKQSLGQFNPGLTQQITGAMIPYTDAIAGAPDFVDQTNGFQLEGDKDLRAVRLSTLFNSDGLSSAAWNGAITDRTNEYAAAYAGLHGQESLDRRTLSEATGDLLGYQNAGLMAEAWDRGLNAEEAELSRVNRINMGVDIAAGMMDTAVPGAGGAFDVANKIYRYDINTPDLAGIPDSRVSVDQSELQSQRYYRMLETLSDRDPEFFNNKSPAAAEFPANWLDNGRLRTYEEIVATGENDNGGPDVGRRFRSAASEWLQGAGLDDVAFNDPAGDKVSEKFDDYASSRDMYQRTVLKGGA